MNSKERRVRRASRTRAIAVKSDRLRFVVSRSNKHIYAQIISTDGSKVLLGLSTLSSAAQEVSGGNIQGAEWLGKEIAQKAVSLGIKEVSFDRSGYKYHGRVKAVAEAARSAGLVF